ncbi:hypothetical protein GCM10029976_046660 [Kribbella albertanoniae]
MVERRADMLQGRVADRRLRIDRGEAGYLQKVVAVAQGHLHRLGQADDESTARARTAGLKEADMSLCGPSAQSKLELAEAPTTASSLESLGKVHVPSLPSRTDSQR